jgi:predicted DNA-binding transcriptional regulator YafY
MLLQRKLWSVVDLARALGVSKATCQRDLDLLADLFAVQVTSDPFQRQRSYYRMVGAFKPRSLTRASARGRARRARTL